MSFQPDGGVRAGIPRRVIGQASIEPGGAVLRARVYLLLACRHLVAKGNKDAQVRRCQACRVLLEHERTTVAEQTKIAEDALNRATAAEKERDEAREKHLADDLVITAISKERDEAVARAALSTKPAETPREPKPCPKCGARTAWTCMGPAPCDFQLFSPAPTEGATHDEPRNQAVRADPRNRPSERPAPVVAEVQAGRGGGDQRCDVPRSEDHQEGSGAPAEVAAPAESAQPGPRKEEVAIFPFEPGKCVVSDAEVARAIRDAALEEAAQGCLNYARGVRDSVEGSPVRRAGLVSAAEDLARLIRALKSQPSPAQPATPETHFMEFNPATRKMEIKPKAPAAQPKPEERRCGTCNKPIKALAPGFGWVHEPPNTSVTDGCQHAAPFRCAQKHERYGIALCAPAPSAPPSPEPTRTCSCCGGGPVVTVPTPAGLAYCEPCLDHVSACIAPERIQPAQPSPEKREPEREARAIEKVYGVKYARPPIFERCEWNPKINAPSCGGEAEGDCENGATLDVGTGRDAFHLCASCAALPAFARRKRREPLEGRLATRPATPSQSPGSAEIAVEKTTVPTPQLRSFCSRSVACRREHGHEGGCAP